MYIKHLTDSEIVSRIQLVLNGQHWDADAIATIAEILQANGYKIDDIDSADYSQ